MMRRGKREKQDEDNDMDHSVADVAMSLLQFVYVKSCLPIDHHSYKQ